jgi:hypothetical protein
MAGSIPNIFHFVFGLKPQVEPFHLLHYLCLKSCIEVNRPTSVYLYYRHLPWGPYWDRIRDSLTLRPVDAQSVASRFEYQDRAADYYRYAHESDFLRLEKLVALGGVYADMDTLFVNPIPAALFEKPFVLGKEQEFQINRDAAPQPSLCNALMMSEPGSKFGQLWLEQMSSAFDGSWSAHSCQLPQQLSIGHPRWVHIEPRRSFFHHACTVEGIRMLFEGCDPDLEGIYSMHLWHHMWAPWWRRDFTRFHEGRLTEEYVRRAETTYGFVANRFLEPNDSVPVPARRAVSVDVPAFDYWSTRAGLRVMSMRSQWASLTGGGARKSHHALRHGQ